MYRIKIKRFWWMLAIPLVFSTVTYSVTDSTPTWKDSKKAEWYIIPQSSMTDNTFNYKKACEGSCSEDGTEPNGR